MQSARITEITIYPIKSCAGTALESSPVTPRGLPYDREWVVVNADGKVLTQRDATHMSLIQPAVSAGGVLNLQAPGMAPIVVPPIEPGDTGQNVDVWGDSCLGTDQGDAAGEWFSAYLKRPCRLLRFNPASQRVTKQHKPDGTPAPLAFTDSCPLLLISEESLNDLNKRLDEPVPMNRFRPSVVIVGMGEYAEDQWNEMSVNGLTLHAAKPCARCVIVSTDQEQGVLRGPEPLQTLNKFRKIGEKVMFGQYFLPGGSGSLRIGDQLACSQNKA